MRSVGYSERRTRLRALVIHVTIPHAAMTTIRRMTPLLVVEHIEPCLPFWEALGFARGATVPEGDAIGFIILEKDGLELMYQSRASVAADVPALNVDADPSGTGLFIEVADLDAVERAVAGAPVVFARRRTFYGMDEICVREPGGRAVTFAQPVAG